MASIVEEVAERVERLEIPWGPLGVDAYGASKAYLRRILVPFAWAYRHYFGVRVHGIENVPARGRVMLVGNHSGGIALDASMVIAAMLLEMEPPRLAQGMVEKFLSETPFVGTCTTRAGQVTGLPEHAERLLGDGRMLMVFPEGARGTAKLYPERYSLVDFGTGFVRLALATGTPIVPFAFLGGGEAIPTVMNAYRAGRLVGAPYLPVTPYLLPLPLPARLDVWFGEPLTFHGTGNEDDEVVHGFVGEVKEKITDLIDAGRAERSPLRAGAQLVSAAATRVSELAPERLRPAAERARVWIERVLAGRRS